MATEAGYCSYLEQFCCCYCYLHFQQQLHRLVALIELIITVVAWLTPAIAIVNAVVLRLCLSLSPDDFLFAAVIVA